MDNRKTVWLGTRKIITGVATHWAVRVGGSDKEYGDWYELDGVTRISQIFGSSSAINLNKDDEYNRINGSVPGSPFKGAKSKLGAGDQIYKVGETEKCNQEIKKFNSRYLEKNPTYNILDNNCQVFAEKLIKWLTDDCFILPETDLQYFLGWNWRIGGVAKDVWKRVATSSKIKIQSLKIRRIAKACVTKVKSVITRRKIKKYKNSKKPPTIITID